MCAFAYELNECDQQSDLGKRLGLTSVWFLTLFKMLPQHAVNILEFAKVKSGRISQMKSKGDQKNRLPFLFLFVATRFWRFVCDFNLLFTWKVGQVQTHFFALA